MTTTVTLTHACAACGASSAAVVTGLQDPADLIPERPRQLLREVSATRQHLEAEQARLRAARGEESPEARGCPAADPVKETEQALARELAQKRMRFATCPRCGARNPEGVEAQRAELRQSRLILAAIFVVLTLGIWYAPRVALGLAAVQVLQSVVFPIAAHRAGYPVPYLSAALGVALGLAFGAVGWYFPAYAVALPALWVAPSLLRNRRAPEDPWKEAAQTIRFEEGQASAADAG